MSAPRPYRSALRDQQARRTRHQIVDAAAELFVEQGYASTTIDSIAERAEVSRRTVFTSVGGKSDVLKLAFDWTLAGDDEPIAIADRPAVQQLMRADSPVDVLEPWIAMNADINQRISPLYSVLVVAADVDSDVATLLATSDQQRLAGARQIVGRIAELGGLHPHVSADEAAAILDVLIDPLSYRRYTDLHRWEPTMYVRRLQAMAAASILG